MEASVQFSFYSKRHNHLLNFLLKYCRTSRLFSASAYTGAASKGTLWRFRQQIERTMKPAAASSYLFSLCIHHSLAVWQGNAAEDSHNGIGSQRNTSVLSLAGPILLFKTNHKNEDHWTWSRKKTGQNLCSVAYHYATDPRSKQWQSDPASNRKPLLHSNSTEGKKHTYTPIKQASLNI